MSSTVPSVDLEVWCWAKGEVAYAPDMFRVSLTAEVAQEIVALRAFFSETNAAFGTQFGGKKLSFLDMPFNHFVADSAEEDEEGVDKRLDGRTLRVREEGVWLIANMWSSRAELKSDKIDNARLEASFEELRQRTLACFTADAVVDALRERHDCDAPARPRSSLSL